MNCDDENRMHNIDTRGREKGDGRGEERPPFPSLATLGRGKEWLCFRPEKPVQEEIKGGLPPVSQG